MKTLIKNDCKPVVETTIHTTVGVYLNKTYKVNGVREEFLKEHIEFNKTHRFGRALLVDGKVEYLGYFNESDRETLEREFGHIKQTVDTQPYE